jgi:protein-L-isoaspartate(D-aspartate) O-methyltransferase
MNVRQSGIGMTSQRTRMRMVERLRAEGIKDEDVLDVMGSVPRHLFVDEALQSRAYDDPSLPIGFGQTISSPFTVARMTELLFAGLPKRKKVLEIGTGCGYQTAILARMAKEVYSVERIGPLLEKARGHLKELKLTNVRYRHSDGNVGLADAAPYDGILMAAAATRVPAALLEQLAVGGRMIIPIGIDEQHLYEFERDECGVREKRHEAVRFVPLLPGIG